MDEKADSKRFWSLEEVAERLGVNYQLIYKEVRAGKLAAVKVGRVYRVPEPDLLAYLERGATATDTAFTCAICRKAFRSRSSIRTTCRDCGKPICFDCSIRGQATSCCGGRDPSIESASESEPKE